jgi:hypothetical protein
VYVVGCLSVYPALLRGCVWLNSMCASTTSCGMCKYVCICIFACVQARAFAHGVCGRFRPKLHHPPQEVLLGAVAFSCVAVSVWRHRVGRLADCCCEELVPMPSSSADVDAVKRK